MSFLQRVLLVVGVAASTLGLSQPASQAGERASVTTGVNLRAGPSSKHKSLGVVPAGALVTVYSCRTGFSWCNVDYRGKRGYLSGRYLTYTDQGEYYGDTFSDVGIYLGVPLFWDDYPIYGPPDRPPNWRPPDQRPPNWRPPHPSHPIARPPRPSHPVSRPPSFQRPSVGGGYGGGRGGGFGGGGGRGGGRR